MDNGGEGMRLLQRTIAGYARHPNFAGLLVIGLGCEGNQPESLIEKWGLEPGALLRVLTIQESGGTRATTTGRCASPRTIGRRMSASNLWMLRKGASAPSNRSRIISAKGPVRSPV